MDIYVAKGRRQPWQDLHFENHKGTHAMSTSNRWTIRTKSPTAGELKNLGFTIRAVAPKAEKPACDAALIELKEAIYDFRLHYPYKSGKNRKTRGRIAEDRDALSTLATAFRAIAAAVKALPLDAKRVFLRAAKAPMGKITSSLDQWSKAASTGYRIGVKKGNRPVDDAPALLAFCVARTLSQTLQRKVSMTSDRNSPGYRGGAGYCRLLRSTLQAAGMDPPIDLVPIMRDGKDLLLTFFPEGDE